MHSHTNQLIQETSPYLLQHAHNPVNWHPWSKEILDKAAKENKPVLVSIGYAACHWCHVMERESFENEATAAIMNEHFINIKIDREERPDLDHIYMDAVQAISGSGGWPLNVFLTPEGKPFYGGTYFPPTRAFNRSSWTEVLQGVLQLFTEKRNEVDAQAENLVQHLLQSNSFGLQQGGTNGNFEPKKLPAIVQQIMKTADTEWGGFGKAPKFPQTFIIRFLLRYVNTTRGAVESNDYNKASTQALTQALLSLDKMIEGGIYDQVGGGFSRYSTDTEWLAPHFEKMLYDNALLITVLSEAWQLTKKERYREVIIETMDFIQREMLHPQKGFYAALDADSEGVEGKFYVWELSEVNELLGDEASIFREYYDITEKGNWEEKNILRAGETVEKFASRKKISVDELNQLLSIGRSKLLTARSMRIRPALDDKIILGWNALMNTACSRAFAVTGNENYRQLAIDNMQFLLKNFNAGENGGLLHTWKNNSAKYPAFLDDYAYLVQALIELQEVTGNGSWLKKAEEIVEYVIEHFSETDTGYFFFTKVGQDDVIIRKKEVYDGAVPSGNSVMATNLYHLSILLDRKEWRERSERMVVSLENAIVKYPGSFGIWAGLLQEMIAGTMEIAVVGEQFKQLHKELLAEYVPHRVLMVTKNADHDFPLLADKQPRNEKTSIWLCENFKCLSPVKSVKELVSLIDTQNRAFNLTLIQ